MSAMRLIADIPRDHDLVAVAAPPGLGIFHGIEGAGETVVERLEDDAGARHVGALRTVGSDADFAARVLYRVHRAGLRP